MVMMSRLESFSKKLVDATSPLPGGRTVNIMNTRGIIIASTEKERIGTFHQGEYDVITTGKENLIYPYEVEKYPGAKQGINMPIVVKNETIGVVGVFGNPDEIRDVANLLKIYVELYFKQLSKEDKVEIEDEIRTKLLKHITRNRSIDKSQVTRLGEMIGWKPEPSFVMLAVKTGLYENNISDTIKLKSLLRHISSLESMGTGKDLYGMINGDILILRSHISGGDASSFAYTLFKAIKKEFKITPSVAVSCIYKHLEETQSAYEGVSSVIKSAGGGVFRMDSYEGMLIYIFQKLSEDPVIREFSMKLLKKMEKDMDEKALSSSLCNSKYDT